jgi:hypothetical protein
MRPKPLSKSGKGDSQGVFVHHPQPLTKYTVYIRGLKGENKPHRFLVGMSLCYKRQFNKRKANRGLLTCVFHMYMGDIRK